ncbi:hypothetical protein L873DRAFT_1716642 [Choiromyces venosus 120613-1]|uniref:Uncharacterized protein n=1 Tax=Choiromyces venosus 120613-1 TaxID=1336337 RepID=A0A3N4IXT7_9PEZI|nr:hypothetical protein L873DRAFT_1716642 [Choiromyces venosus 120613-1]
MGLQFDSPLLVSSPPRITQPILQHPVPHKSLLRNFTTFTNKSSTTTNSNTFFPLVPCPESLFLQTSPLPMSYQPPPPPPPPQPSPSPPLFAATSSKKRSPQIAFADDTPPSSRPPSRSHTQKRLRAKRATERPGWVSSKDDSIGLDARVEAVVVDVLWPGAESLEFGRRVGDLWRSRGFTVLCFLGCTIEPLQSLSHVASLLDNLNANVFGISLSAPPPHTSSLPIIYDRTRALTLSLGLLHPLGGGRQALDAIVILDRDSRQRVVLPVGWGARSVPGQCTADEESNSINSVVGRCVKGVEWLCSEALDDTVEDVEMGMMDNEIVMAAL